MLYLSEKNNLFLRLILNEANAYTTGTMHWGYIYETTNKNAFISNFYNSLSLAFSEIVGRSYGGGVLECQVKLSRYYCPISRKMMRENKNIYEILKITNKVILKDGYGFTEKEINLTNSIWKKLSSRRLNRNR